MTGRAAGFCTGYGVPGYTNLATGRGCRAWGGGRGYRNWFYGTGLTGWQRASGCMPAWGNPFVYGGRYYAPATPVVNRQQEVDALKARAEYLEDALEGIRMQLRELEEKQTGTRSG